MVTVMAEQDGRLATIGRLGGLGRGERVYAVRFIGDLGYVVTFRQVDPLHVIDVSDPAQSRAARSSAHPRLLRLPPSDRRRPTARDRSGRNLRRPRARHPGLRLRRHQPRQPGAACTSCGSAKAPRRSSSTITPSSTGRGRASPCCRSSAGASTRRGASDYSARRGRAPRRARRHRPGRDGRAPVDTVRRPRVPRVPHPDPAEPRGRRHPLHGVRARARGQ